MGEIKNIGRIHYIEPNDFLNKNGNDNKINNYEDYSISVDLIVSNPSRYAVSSNNKNHTISGNEYNLGTFSFFSGDNSMLTNSPGTMVYSDLLNGDIKGVNENLGITNIHITYNSYFYPEVTINFTDIRGTALMMPHEENYMREQINAWYGETKFDKKVEHFFTSIFSFPSPEFKLRVKGFYGKKIEYSLLVKDLKTSFNPSTGNFDARLDLIGKMYGVYTDIPMSYLLIAPYCRYGSYNNKTIWEESGFKYDNGMPMPTFLELKDKLQNSNIQLSTLYNPEKSKKYTLLLEKVKLLNTIDEYLNVLFHHISLELNIDIKDKAMVIPEEDLNKIDTDYFRTLISNIYSAIQDYNLKFNGEINLFNGMLSNGKVNDENKCNMYFLGYESDYTVFIENKKNFNQYSKGKFTFYIGEFIKDKFREKYKNKNPYDRDYYYIVYFDSTKNDIDNLLKTINNELNQEKEEMQKNIDQECEKVLGFIPSIRTIFKMLMAHIDCFANLFHRLLNSINSSNRNVSGDFLCDLKNSNSLPAFPAVKDNIENKYVYPESINFNIEECKFIDSLFNAAGDFQKLEIEFSNRDNSDIELIPTCASDIYLINNPYKYVFKENNGNDFIDWIMTFFALRLMNAFGYKQILPSGDNDNFGYYESFNFWKVNQNLSQYIINQIDNQEFNGEKFLNFLNANYYLKNKKTPCYNSRELIKGDDGKKYFQDFIYFSNGGENISQDSLKFMFYNFKDKKMHLIFEHSVDIFNPRLHAFLIGRDEGGFKTFRNDVKTPTPEFCYINDTTPYGFIKLLPKELFEDWEEKLNKITIPSLNLSGSTYGNLFKAYQKACPTIFTNDKDENILKIFYNKGYYSNTFIERYSELKDANLKQLSNYYSDNLPDEWRLLAINSGFISIFFNTGLTAEEFLLNIQWSAENLHPFFNVKQSDIKKDTTLCGILNLPQPVLLLLGMYISYLKKGKKPWFLNDNGSETKDDYHYIHGGGVMGGTVANFPYYVYGNDYLDVTEKSITGTLKGYKGGWVYPIIYHNFALLSSILGMLIRYGDGTRVDFEPKTANDNTRLYWSLKNLDNFFNEMIKNKDKGIIDILGLSEKYEEWARSEQIGGFEYFKKNYCLTERDVKYNNKSKKYEWSFSLHGKNSNNNSKTEFPTKLKGGDTTFKRLTNIKSNLESVIDEKINTVKYERDNNKRVTYNYTFWEEDELMKKTFNSLFKSPYNNESTTPFDDRYSNVILTKSGITACFNVNFPAYKHLHEFFHKNEVIVVPDLNYREENLNVFFYDENDIVNHFNNFKNGLITLYKGKKDENNKMLNFNSNTVSEESKTSIYYTLKNLFDKHFHDLPDNITKYKVDSYNGEYSRIFYIDTFYNDIGDNIICNTDYLIDLLNQITGSGVYSERGDIISSMDAYSFMANLCQKHNMMLLAMPFFYNVDKDDKNGDTLKKMFTPLSHNQAINDNIITGPYYICFYPHQASKHLDIANSQYENDGFNIIEDINGTGSFEGPTSIPDLYINDDSDYEEANIMTIPAFGVEYGSQKQSIFKSVNVNMDNPKTTEASVAMQFNLIKNKNNTPNHVGFEGQDLFKIYSNYSYTCEVEMMGCAQIQPLMYFQLNNIPMFRGAYQIIKVEHDITPGDMTTKFTGVRINRTKMPMVKSGVNVQVMDDIMKNKRPYYEFIYNKETPSISLIGDAAKNSNHLIINANYDLTFIDFTNNTNIKVSKIDSYVPSGDEDTNPKAAAFNRLNPYLKNMIIAIDKRMKDNGLGISISSMARNKNSSSNSDHTVPSTKDIRVKLGLSNLGCAVDLQGEKDGKVNKSDASIPLFHLIATEFTDSINQLIWETNKTQPSHANYVSHCVHVSSYGLNAVKNPQIFVASQSSGFKSIPAEFKNGKDKAPTNIPPLFIKTLYDLSQDNDKYNKITLNNFKSGKPTQEALRKWCKELNV